MIKTVKNINDEDVDIRRCDNCGAELDGAYYEDNGDYCPECYFCDSKELKATMTLDNALKCGSEYCETVKINQFLECSFSADEIEQILINEFNNLPEDIKKQKLRYYAETGNGADIGEWIDFCADNGDENAKKIKNCERWDTL